jgi:hypothetical protein
MDIFESLENLNVSEECFDDIMGIVEDLLSEDIKSEIHKKVAPEKRYELLQKVDKNKENEMGDRYTRQVFKNYFSNGIKDYAKASVEADKQIGVHGEHETSKNKKGSHKTHLRSIKSRDFGKSVKSGYNSELRPILNSIRKQVEKREKQN